MVPKMSPIRFLPRLVSIQSIHVETPTKFYPLYRPSLLKGPFDNKSAFVQVMAWRQTDHKPFPETVLAEFHDLICRLFGNDWTASFKAPIPCFPYIMNDFAIMSTVLRSIKQTH